MQIGDGKEKKRRTQNMAKVGLALRGQKALIKALRIFLAKKF